MRTVRGREGGRLPGGAGREGDRGGGDPRRSGNSGDGGPATAARLRCAGSIAVGADGGILIADLLARRIRRVDPAGVISTVAGTGRRAISGDGGAATAAAIGSPAGVATLPGGGFAIASARFARNDRVQAAIRVVDGAGIITTRAGEYATALAAEPDGSLLLTNGSKGDAPVRRLRPDGTLSVAAAVGDRIGIPEFLRVAGDPLGSVAVITDAAVPTPDGGMLLSTDFGISYVAAPSSQVLAVAMLPATRHVRPDLEVSVRLTRGAHVTVEARRKGRVRARASLDAPAGDAVVSLGRVRPGLYRVRVVTEEAGHVATARARVLAGGRLPVSFVRGFVTDRLGLSETFDRGGPKLGRCTRRGSLRVDCRLRRQRRCVEVVSVRQRADGTLSARSRGCRR